MANKNITESFIQSGTKCRSGVTRAKKWIVIHETGNQSKGAGAANHAIYLSNLSKQNNTYLSWHYTVDSESIYHHMPDNEIAWHAGDGENEGGGNMAGIGIEICVNPESDYNTAVDNAASLVADLLKQNNLTVSSVKQHHDFSSCGKNCPQRMREQGLWSNFIDKVTKYYAPAKKENPTGEKVASTAFSVGDSVILNGYVYVDSYASKAGQKFSAKKCVVTRIVDTSREAPYLLDNGLGWAKKADLTKSSATAEKKLCVGSTVEVNGNLYTDSYGGKAVRTVTGKYVVSRIIEGRKAGILLNTNFGWVEASSCKVI